MKRWYVPFAVLVFVIGFQLAAFADNCGLCQGSTSCPTPPGCTVSGTSPRQPICAGAPPYYPECCQFGSYTKTYNVSPTCSTLTCTYRVFEFCGVESTCINGSCQAN